MAGTAKVCRREHGANSEVYNLRTELNKVITDLETLRAGLDAVATHLDGDAAITVITYVTDSGCGETSAMTAATVNSGR